MRKQIQKTYKTIIVLLLALSMLLPGTTVIAKAENARTVKVGVFEIGNFLKLGENGDPTGYYAEYVNKLEEYTHWNIEYVKVDNWRDGLKQLDAGKIDLIAPAEKTAEREEQYVFSAYSMSTELGAIYTLPEREDLIYDDFNTLSTLHYGAVENSPITDNFFDEYAKNAGFTPQATMYPDMTSLFQALYNKEVDAIATNIMLGDDTVKMIGRYSPSPVYFITPKAADNTAMMDELDDAMTDLRLDDPTFENNLFHKYFKSFSNTELTQKELDYVASLPKVKVGYETNHAPISSTDDSGEMTGITRDVLDQIAQLSGIQFEYVPLPASEITADYLKSQKIYVLANVEYNDVNTGVKGLHLSTPYLSSDKVLVGKSGLQYNAESQLTLARCAGSATLEESISQTYPNFKYVKFNTLEECFDAVKNGEADASLQNRYVAESLLSNPHYGELSVLPLQSIDDDLCVGTMDYQDGSQEEALINQNYFISIMDKCIKQITSDQLNDSVIRNTEDARYQVTALDMIRQNLAVCVLLLLLVVACILFLFYRQHMERSKANALEVKNRDLSDAVNQAEKANLAKSQFLSRMSHEIRTPMNAIVGITAIAKQHNQEPEKVTDYLNKIESSSHVLLNIINDVLDMSAIESEKLKIANVEFDIKGILNNLTNVYYPQCSAKGVELLVMTDIQNEILVGDSLRVNQILMNIISNAYKFTPSGGKITIAAKQTAQKEDQVYIQFQISDTGAGMTEEMQKRLFKPFEQESSTTAQKHGGSGLGMSIAKNLVDMMHGAIKVDSKKDVGTTFTVDLPFGYIDENPMENKDKLKNVKALVVDDDQEALEYTSLVLERIGVKYEVANDGATAISMANDAHNQGSGYDICFVDWRMPGMTGIQVTRQLRQLFDKDTMIIIVSAYDLSEVEEEATAAGADMFISKPLFQSTVFNVLMNLSGGQYLNETANEEDYDFTGHRVLMAEDNALNREIAMELLDLVNLKVECAENGQEAIEKFNASEPGYYEAILMDIQMPIKNGFEATEGIRSGNHPNAKTVPIYAMTANAFSEDVSASLNAGMNGHISKPIDTDVLYKTLAKIMLK